QRSFLSGGHNQISLWRADQRHDFFCAHCGCGLLPGGDAGERTHSADEKGSRAGRSNYEEVPRVPERDSHRRAALRALHSATGGEGCLKFNRMTVSARALIALVVVSSLAPFLRAQVNQGKEPLPPSASIQNPKKVRVSQGVMQHQILHKVDAKYPKEAL